MSDRASISMPQHITDCLAACQRCHDECHATLFGHCIPTGGAHAEATHVKLMMDCIDICNLAVGLLLQHSPLRAVTVNACAEICQACAVACEKMGGDQMLVCAQQCRNCANACYTAFRAENAVSAA